MVNKSELPTPLQENGSGKPATSELTPEQKEEVFKDVIVSYSECHAGMAIRTEPAWVVTQGANDSFRSVTILADEPNAKSRAIEIADKWAEERGGHVSAD